MVITTDRLILREFTLDDFDSTHEYAKDKEFSQYEAWGPNTEEQTKEFLIKTIDDSTVSPRSNYELAVALKTTKQHIGGASLRADHNTMIGNFGYAINPRFQRLGYATEAAKALIYFGFNELKLSLIYATCDVLNVASYTVMEKLGMKRVSIIRNDMVIDGRNRDTYRYEIKPSAVK